MMLAANLPAIGWIGVNSLLFIGIYFMAVISGLFRDFLMMLITAILLTLSIGAGTFLALARTVGIERLPIAAPMFEFV
jgi:hypothetical protein